GEGTAAMGRRAAISVHDDLAAGQARIAIRPTDDEITCRVHIEFFFGREPASGEHLAHITANELAQVGLLDAFLMLRGDHNRGDTDRFAVFIAQRYLAL